MTLRAAHGGYVLDCTGRRRSDCRGVCRVCVRHASKDAARRSAGVSQLNICPRTILAKGRHRTRSCSKRPIPTCQSAPPNDRYRETPRCLLIDATVVTRLADDITNNPWAESQRGMSEHSDVHDVVSPVSPPSTESRRSVRLSAASAIPTLGSQRIAARSIRVSTSAFERIERIVRKRKSVKFFLFNNHQWFESHPLRQRTTTLLSIGCREISPYC